MTKDRQGVRESGLDLKIDGLYQGYIVIADCAYQPTEKLIPIFGGDLALRKENDNFNFFASQLRIRIEMAFGIMTRKWGILQRPLTISLGQIKHLICCIARLHNFCIDERLGTNEEDGPAEYSEEESLTSTQLSYMYAAAEAEHHEILSEEYAQWSIERDNMVDAVKQLQLQRPLSNRTKKRARGQLTEG